MTEELPDEFWLSIRHISSFSNKQKYDEYLKLKIEEYKANEERTL